MKTVRTFFLNMYNVILTSLIGLLGFASSCDSIVPEPAVEYGTPSAKFIVNGKIEADDNNVAIENIRVVMMGDTAFTNAEGKYEVDCIDFPTDQSFALQIEDVDGDTNGSFSKQDTVVMFKDPQFVKGDGHWYNGETSQTFNVKLERKK